MSNSFQEKAAALGEPSYVWRAGQERRLKLILEAAEGRQHGVVLDNGCGIGMYLRRLSSKASKSFGLELDRNRALAAQEYGSVVIAVGEALPLPANRFDLILSHEVLEHVQDDRLSIKEMVRILRRPDHEAGTPGGRLLIFVPNRGYPFETHGIYWRGKYHFGNIPLVNYLPDGLRDQLAPHVRVYRKADVHKLVGYPELELIDHKILFGAYDNVIARFPRLGKSLRGFLQSLERTPLRFLGLSHFIILERQ